MPTASPVAGRLLALAVSLISAGCEPGPGIHAQSSADARARAAYRSKLDTGNWLSPAQAARMIRQRPGLQLVCVANIEDYRAGHLPGSMLIPVMALRLAVGDNAPSTIYPAINRGRTVSKDRPVLIYCWWNACKCPTVPTYSELARAILRKKGFRNVYSIEGGMRSWIAACLPCEKGEPAPSVTPPTTRPAGHERRRTSRDPG